MGDEFARNPRVEGTCVFASSVICKPVVHPHARDAFAHELGTWFVAALPFPHLLSGICLADDKPESGTRGSRDEIVVVSLCVASVDFVTFHTTVPTPMGEGQTDEVCGHHGRTSRFARCLAGNGRMERSERSPTKDGTMTVSPYRATVSEAFRPTATDTDVYGIAYYLADAFVEGTITLERAADALAEWADHEDDDLARVATQIPRGDSAHRLLRAAIEHHAA